MMIFFTLLLAVPQATVKEKPMIVAGIYTFTRQIPDIYYTMKWGNAKYGFEPRLTVIKGQAAIKRLREMLGEPTILPAVFARLEQKAYLFTRNDHPKMVGMMVRVHKNYLELRCFDTYAGHSRGIGGRAPIEIEKQVYAWFQGLLKPEPLPPQ